MPNHAHRPLRTRPLPDAPAAEGTYLLLLTVDDTPTAPATQHDLQWVDSTDYENA